MTRHGGGSFGGGGGGGHNFGSHGRSSGGSFGGGPRHHHVPPPHHHHPPPPHLHPPPPHHHGQAIFGPYSTPIVYSSLPVVDTRYESPPPAVPILYGRQYRLNQSKVVFAFIFILLIFVMYQLVFGYYGSTVIQLGVHDSRLITSNSFLVKSMKFSNGGGLEGPLFYVFDHKPALNQETNWVDSQNVTFHNGHWVVTVQRHPPNFAKLCKEFYYWMNKGSTVKIFYELDMPGKNQPVFLAILRDDPEDLEDYYDRPDRRGWRLREHGVFDYEAGGDADYVFSLVTYNHKDSTVYLDMHFSTRGYDTEEATEHHNLKTKSEMQMPIFRTSYGLLMGPQSDKMEVDTWEIKVSYKIRSSSIIFMFGLVACAYAATYCLISCELDPSVPERAPLILPQQGVQEAQETNPSAPILPATIPEEDESPALKDKEMSDEQLCSVCLDAPKDSFFVPCGHRATCHTCGLRISKSEPANCPICRQPITDVKKIYDA